MQPVTLLQLNRRLSNLIASGPGLHDVWITAETSDVRVTGGHCYMELIQKDPGNGVTIAKARATIWASVFPGISAMFFSATGQRLASGMKIMACVTAVYHIVYGMSLNITAIDPEYTMGDLMRRRNEMIARLRREGILDMNRTLVWPDVVQRIAVISAKGAAGYGDFIDQLYSNPSRLRFYTRLFPAVLQGGNAPSSIIAALEDIASDIDAWDCVVIIRGGGATSDLASFDDYDLAANIAQFPIPVIVGIGHERDVTILDYVANMRVKTPTAAAEWLITKGDEAIGKLHTIAAAILQSVTDRIGGCHRQLAYYYGLLPSAVGNRMIKAKNKVGNAHIALVSLRDRKIRPEISIISHKKENLDRAVSHAVSRAWEKLYATSRLLSALSPESTLKRGYSITRVSGHAITGASQVGPGDILETILGDGRVFSQVKDNTIKQK